MTINDDTIEIVDQRIRQHLGKEKATATVVSRATTGNGVNVVEDGSSVVVPAKVLGVFCQPGDRVTLGRYGSDWLVTGSFSADGYGEANRWVDGLSAMTGALTSSVFTDMQEFGTFTFTKLHDATFILADFRGGAYCQTTAGTKAQWAFRLTPFVGGDGYTPSDILLTSYMFNALNDHRQVSAARRVINVPAGTYTVTVRWRRVSGTGSLRADTDDVYSLALDEKVRASVRVL